MSSEIDIQFVQETYQRMSDGELTRVLTQEATGLTPEAQEVVKGEIRRRNLDPNIVRGVEAQQKTYTIAELEAYCEIIQKLPDPLTGNTSERLNATLMAEVKSFVFFTHYKEKILIGTPRTLDAANNSALRKTMFLGWWCFPSGIIKSIKAIRINLTSKRTNNIPSPSDYLRTFVLSKIGEIETYKDNKERLLELIS
ncbi:MAG: hypothetical protein EPN39_09590 [Chitinophagaceae bacterium]|nr:MAG: hypothetical protein EPN39_09590 [Chitinophagaceae bacterium]